MRLWGVAAWYSGNSSNRQTTGLLTCEGPYAYTRNPRYLGNLLMGLGGCALAGLPQCYWIYAIVWWLIHGPIVASEEYHLRERFGDAYVDYCKRVPRFLGKLSPRARLSTQLSSLKWSSAVRAEASTIGGWWALGWWLQAWRLFRLGSIGWTGLLVPLLQASLLYAALLYALRKRASNG